MAKRAPLGQVADVATLRRVAAEAERTEPPAIVRTPRRTVMVGIKLSEASAVALANKAVLAGVTQKQLIARALADAGVGIDPVDLEDRTPRRRATVEAA
jgi:hypothetical protein